MQQRNYDDDDGRTIADMSDIGRTPMLLPRLPKRKKSAGEPEQAIQQPEPQLTDEERRSYIGGALGAAMLIGGIFIGVGAVVILLLTLLWR
ncbi:MAG: hypothetical protein IJK89_12890 [Clostridia bacterium]|nr:hypothetical protein [Clostridia bacterium]